MKNIWYYIMRFYIKCGLFFLHKEITVYGKENIPKKGALLFIGNHQNALIDAILIPTTTKRKIHFLARASAFKNKPISKFLSSLNMIPVYRIRDGIKTIEKNHQVFDQCVELLHQEKAVEIFAEGEHHLKRKVLPFKKGFARIISSALQKYPNLKIQIVPVGINYDSRLNFPASVSLHYGQPILANDYIDTTNTDLRFSKIINKVSLELKKLTVHVEDDKNYDDIIFKSNKLNIDYTNPLEANKLIKNIDSISLKSGDKKGKTNWLKPLHYLTKINSILPLLIWKYLKPKIKDVIFTNTYRFALIMTIFPLFYLIQTAIVFYFSNLKFALVYLVSSVVLSLLSTKTMRVNLIEPLE